MNYGTLQRDDEEAKDPSSWQNLRLKEETEKQRDDWRWEFRLSSLSKRERRNQQQRIYLIGICSLLMILLFPLSVIILLSGIQNNEDCLVPEISFGERYEDYDYIVVGGGPSGILVASKLARKLENTSARVLLLESGTTSQSSVVENLENMERTNVSPPPTGLAWAGGQGAQLNQFDIPLLWSGAASSQGRLTSSTIGDEGHPLWSFHHWPIRKTLLARALGGCGLHNAMLYVRALSSDIEKWNLTGWDFETLLEYYKDLETYVDTNWPKPDLLNSTSRLEPWRGTSGPIWTVPAGPALDSVGDLFIQSSAKTIGIAKTQGFNDPDPNSRLGAGYYEFNIRNGVRDSIAQVFLGKMWNNASTSKGKAGEDPIPHNLDVRTGATVTRVLFGDKEKGENPKTVGVEYVDLDGRSRRVFLKSGSNRPHQAQEVILASGAIMTPQLLANSGIWENGEIADLPGVGKNLQDHPVVAMAFELAPNVTQDSSSIYTMGEELEDYYASVIELKSILNDDDLNLKQRQMLHRQIGALGTAGFSTGAFLRSPWARGEDPDLQLTVFPRSIEPHVARKQRNSEIKFMRSRVMLVTVALLNADARYEVKPAMSGQISETEASLADTMHPYAENPMTKNWNIRLPSINLPKGVTEYLSDMDVQRFMWGIHQVRKIQKTPPLSDYTLGEVFPGSPDDKVKLKEFIQEHHLPNSHWSGSTAMGNDDDPMAVLDERFSVRKVRGLRVVDSGAIPTVPNGNTHSTVCVVASRAADFILEDRELSDN